MLRFESTPKQALQRPKSLLLPMHHNSYLPWQMWISGPMGGVKGPIFEEEKNFMRRKFSETFARIRHSLGSSRKSVHERHRNSDGLQVKWSVLRAIWLKRQDP